jgi:hypothetical protein
MTSQILNAARNFCRPSRVITFSGQLFIYFSQLFYLFYFSVLLSVRHDIKENELDNTYSLNLTKIEDNVFDGRSIIKK